MRIIIQVFIMFLLLNINLFGEWPQYLGPDRNGISPETDLETNWTETGPKVLWQQSLGTGFAGAAISEGKVYLLDRVDMKYDVLRCFDLQSGEELWHYSHKDSGTFDFNGSRATPTIDGDYAYCVGPMGKVYCINLKTQKPQWIRNFRTGFDAEMPYWAFSQSPLLYKDLVIVAPQCEQVGVVAYVKNTGEIAWKTPRLSNTSGYVSPTLTTIDGVDQIIQVTPYEVPEPETYEETDQESEESEKEIAVPFEGGGVYGIDPNTGEILWNYKNFPCSIPIPPVTAIGDGRLFISGGYQASPTMIQVKQKDGVFEVQELFKKEGIKIQIHPALLYKNHLYMNANDNSSHEGLVCMSLDGEVLWKTRRKPNFEKGGLILADDKIFIVEGKRGDLYVVEPDPSEYREMAKFNLLERPQIWAPLALSDGKLLIRDKKQLKCIDLSRK